MNVLTAFIHAFWTNDEESWAGNNAGGNRRELSDTYTTLADNTLHPSLWESRGRKDYQDVPSWIFNHFAGDVKMQDEKLIQFEELINLNI
jgi:hypothetical protein